VTKLRSRPGVGPRAHIDTMTSLVRKADSSAQ
jgi:hypothetical protein